MLFLLNSLDPARLDEVQTMAGKEDISLVLYGDASYYATPAMIGKLSHIEFEDIFVAQDALASRNISPAENVEAVGQDAIADMILNDHDRIVSL